MISVANTLTNYQCPACTGPLRFDGKAGKLVCDYCGSQYEVADMEARYAEKQAQADRGPLLAQAEAPLWGQEETSGLRQLQLSFLRGRAGLRRHYGGFQLPLLRQSHRYGGTVHRPAKARVHPALPHGPGRSPGSAEKAL